MIQKSEIHYPPEVLFVADDKGIFDASVVDIEHIDIKRVFVIRQVDPVAGAGGAAFVIAELGIVQIDKGGGRNGNGIFTHQDRDRFDGGMRCLAIVAAVIGFAVYPQQVLIVHHQLVFGGDKDACLDRYLYIVALEYHEIKAKVLDWYALQMGFPDAFVKGGHGEGGDVGADILFADLGKIIFFGAEVREVEVLGQGRKPAHDQGEA